MILDAEEHGQLKKGMFVCSIAIFRSVLASLHFALLVNVVC
jgi:hypothetical protein